MLQDVKCQVRRMRGGGFELFGGKFLLEVIINIWGHDYLQLGWNGFGDVARCQVSSEVEDLSLVSSCKSDASCMSSQVSCKRASKESCHMHELGGH